MPNLFRVSRLVRACCLSAVALLACGTMWAGSTTVVISQVYGGGGSAAGVYNADYIEIFNASSAPIDISGYAVQYGSATGTSTTAPYAIPPGTTLAAGQYYLVAATAGTGLANLPVTPDVTYSAIALSATAGKVFLTNTSAALTLGSNGCPTTTTSVVDMVGFGTTANCYEGTGPAPAPSTTTADIRVAPCADSDQNASDFSAQAPNPHNTSSTKAPCVAIVPTTTITISESSTKAVTGTPVVFTAVVMGNLTAPTGTVTFKDGSTVLTGATSSTSGSTTTWTLTTSALSIATHTITASFAADSVYPANTTTTPASLSVQITPVPTPDITLSIANTQLIATSSSKVQTSVVTVNMVAGFNSPVTLSCSGAPGGSRCVFSPATLTTSGNSTLTIAIDGAGNHMPGRASERVTLALAALALPVLFWRRKRLARVMLAVVALGVLSLGMVGCSDSNSTPSGTSTLTVTATGGGVTHTATITLLVQ